MKALKIAALVVTVSFLSACGGEEDTPTAILAPTARGVEEPTETVPALPTAVPSPTEPSSPTPLPSLTPSPIPTVTPVPTQTPAPTITASPTTEAPSAAPTATGETAESDGGETSIADITDIAWLWEAFQDPAGLNDLTVTDPEKYTLTLLEDGTAAIQADCNQLSWTYSLQMGADSSSGSLTFSPLGPSTLAFCGEESLDQEYLTWLGEVATYVAMGNELFLNLRFDSGNMLFGLEGDLAETDTTADTEETPESSEEQELPADYIEIDLQGLAQSYEWEVVAGSPIPSGPGGQGFPNHIVLGFDGEDPLEVPYSERRILYAFPIQAYLSLYRAAGNTAVEEQVRRLTELINTAPDREHIPDGPMSLLPPPNSLMDRWAQFADLNFTQGQGIRYTADSPFRQSIGVWTNDSTDYYYQGLTADGRYYISFKWPVSSALLPNTPDDASEETRQQAESGRESYDQYLLDLKNALNATGPADWSPDLTKLDALIASLSIKNQ